LEQQAIGRYHKTSELRNSYLYTQAEAAEVKRLYKLLVLRSEMGKEKRDIR
jgi:hypothetical protein